MTEHVLTYPVSQVLPSEVQVVTRGPTGKNMSASEVIVRLEAAGATLLAMPARGYSTKLRQMKFDIVHTTLEAYGGQLSTTRLPVPSAAAISAMDEAFGWLVLIPEERYVLRRILGARALVHPLTGRHLYPWRRLGAVLGSDHKTIQRWHGQAVELLSRALPG
ncbi:MAG: hypothetical protein B7X08_05310 [Acidocella sp. 20-63-7]|nr:MAG: hypothetical protein B7X08_05310 [Acidocella sp. 20-63-7]HQT46631.1 DUF6362 family protein [Acidocella sp.]